MKKTLISCLLLVVVLCFCEQVKFVSGDFYPPFIYRNERGEAVGISIEILKAIEKVSDLRFNVELMPFSKALELVKNGEADMINLIFRTPEREKFFLFSKPVLQVQSLVWFRKDLNLKDFKDLTAHIVGVIEGDANEQLLRSKNPNIVFKRFTDFEQLIQAVKERQIDVFIMEDLTAGYYLVKHDLYHLFDRLPPISSQWTHFAFSSNRSDLMEKVNGALERLSKSEFQRIVELFIKPRFIFPRWLFHILLYGGIGVFLAVFILTLINKRLAYLVAQRTQEIRKKNEELQTAYEELDAFNQQLRATNEELEAMNQELMNLNKRLEDKTLEAEKFHNAFQTVLDVANKITFETIQEKDFLITLLRVFKYYLPEPACVGVALRSSEAGKTLFSLLKGEKSIIDRVEKIYDFDSEESFNEVLKTAQQLCGEDLNTEVKFLPIKSQEVPHGVFFFACEQINRYQEEYLKKFAVLIATLLSLRSYVREQGIFQRRLLGVVVKALEYYDYYTRGHSENVARYASLLAERLSLDKASIRRVFWAGMVHDVGKIFVPQHILNKNGFLTAEEYEFVKIHPVKSFELLVEAGLEEIARITKHHHERFDGKGYPDGLRTEDIPFESRLLCLVDAFDAMTTDRPYKKGLNLEEAIVEIERCSGSQFDPQLAKVFTDMLKEKPELFTKRG